MDGPKENRIPVGWAPNRKMEMNYSKYIGQRYMAQHSHYFYITDDFKTQKIKMLSATIRTKLFYTDNVSDNFKMSFFV